jgi:hypothetical protein
VWDFAAHADNSGYVKSRWHGFELRDVSLDGSDSFLRTSR